MPLPMPAYPRKPLHNRSIKVHSFEREDGLWDLEAELIDSKAFDYTKRDGSEQKAGQAFHHMHLRITIDSSFTIQEASAAYDASPFGEPCTSIAGAYGDLVGMNLLKSFRQQVKERFSRTDGCTHMTELAAVLPTAAVQTMSGQRRNAADPTKRPYQLGGCTAWRLDGEITKALYPQWYIAPETSPSETPDK
ncbi:MAG: DUF2889 domain-containing protein [Alcaligenaceae bacterium]